MRQNAALCGNGLIKPIPGTYHPVWPSSIGHLLKPAIYILGHTDPITCTIYLGKISVKWHLWTCFSTHSIQGFHIKVIDINHYHPKTKYIFRLILGPNYKHIIDSLWPKTFQIRIF